jgi:hypothetical protein
MLAQCAIYRKVGAITVGVAIPALRINRRSKHPKVSPRTVTLPFIRGGAHAEPRCAREC